MTGNVINTTQFQLEYIVKSGKLYTYKKNTYNIYSINVDYSTFKIFMICTKLRCIYNLTFNILYTNRGHYKLQIKYKIKSFLNHFKKINYEYSNRWNRICGLVSGTCFAEMGINVTCIDVNKEKINNLLQGNIPIYEPGLDEMVIRNHREGRLNFSTDLASCLNDVEIVFCAVGTPPDENGSADLKYVLEVAHTIGINMINTF